MSKRQQSKSDLDRFYSKDDPWGYFSNDHDRSRKQTLLGELNRFHLGRVLDIGCGNGFITEAIQADEVVGIDLSEAAIAEARKRSQSAAASYRQGSLFDLSALALGRFDAVLVTGVLYEQYIGNSLPLVYQLIDEALLPDGLLVSVHIENWYSARFPYALIKSVRYRYREYQHLLEIYRK